MDIRAQVSMVFHLDKCIGCHTCSISCKNIWSDRLGTEYMWWNNVETKPGTGYPTLYEDQEKYKGGWELKGDNLRLKMQGRLAGLANIFFNPFLPTVDDYYEPWTYQYDELFNAPEGDDQPTARPISAITGAPIDIEAGPNWDDDLGGSPIYAANDPNLAGLTDEQRLQLFEMERVVFFHLPRICNHCLNPGCLAACPAGAIYKRGEDGVVLVKQDQCRAWRMCISGCPYKKTYYNWSTGKSEKCILCYPRLETGQAPACFHSCVGRIRYLGVLLYDADLIEATAKFADADLVDAQRAIIQDPFDPQIIKSAQANGVSDAMIDAAQKSPVYKFVKTWKLALPLHPEFRTIPMLFYVPPLLPVISTNNGGGSQRLASDFFSSLQNARLPMRYMANLFSAGNEAVVTESYVKLMALRVYQRAQRVGDITPEEADKALAEARVTAYEAEDIYRLTSLATFEDRFVLPALARESAVESFIDPFRHKIQAGFGFRESAKRGW